MATVSSLNPLNCISRIQYGSVKPIVQVNSIRIASTKAAKFYKHSTNLSLRPRRGFKIQAVCDDDDYSFEQDSIEEGDATSAWGEELQPEEGEGNVNIATAVLPEELQQEKGDENVSIATVVLPEELQQEEGEQEASEITSLKKALFDALYGTGCGLRASNETRAEILEILSELEAKNPTPAPTEALQLLNGKWILACMSLPGLLPSMASRAPIPLKVAQISQTIDSENLTVHNSVLFDWVFTTTSLSTNAKFEVRSPKRVQIKFVEGIIGTPQLTESVVLPESFEFMGQKIDLTPFMGLIASIRDNTSSVMNNISSHSPLKIPIADYESKTWLLTTYLDKELRISRDENGSVFILVKDGSPLLAAL